MATLSTVPGVVDVSGYGGDTLTLRITPAAGVADGLTWKAQVRPVRNASTVDGTFTVVQPTTPGGHGYITLDTETTASLTSGSRYVGVWDLQASNGGNDPVITLVQGALTLEMDVTR